MHISDVSCQAGRLTWGRDADSVTDAVELVSPSSSAAPCSTSTGIECQCSAALSRATMMPSTAPAVAQAILPRRPKPPRRPARKL